MRWGIALVVGVLLAGPAVVPPGVVPAGMWPVGVSSAAAQGARQEPASRQAARPAAPAQRSGQAQRGGQAPRSAQQSRNALPVVVTPTASRQPAARAATAGAASRTVTPYRQAAGTPMGRAVRDPNLRHASLHTRNERLIAPLCASGHRTCGPTRATALRGGRQMALRWQGGLSPADGQQSECPDGTVAVLAIGHSDVYRCMPY